MRRWFERTPTPDSARIGSRFQSGDRSAAEEVRQRVEKTLAFRGYQIPREDRLDLAQAAMAQIWEAANKPGFDPTAGFWGFVEVVVARRCIDWLRSRREEVPFDTSIAMVDSSDPQRAALRRERRDLARAALERLPDGCRELIRLHVEEDKSYAEAAEILGASEGALRVRMHRCIQRAQRALRELEDSENLSAGV